MLALHRALTSTLTEFGHSRLEFELRLGRYQGDRFISGIPKTSYDKIKSALDGCAVFDTVTSRHTIERLNGTDARFIMPDGDDHRGVWNYKKKVATVELSRHTRAAISLEDSRGDPPLPDAKPFMYRRDKRRTSYVFKCWSIDLTEVASNLPQHLDHDGLLYEVEVELHDTSMFFVYTIPHLIQWGSDLLEQLHDVCK